MIRIRLDYLLLDRRMKLTDVAAKTGIALNNLSVLKTNKARAIRFSTLEAICRAMDCTPGQLIEYVPEAERTGAAPLLGENENANDDPE
jgi:putative transcriptional regulator